jgi:hypothetical protein
MYKSRYFQHFPSGQLFLFLEVLVIYRPRNQRFWCGSFLRGELRFLDSKSLHESKIKKSNQE